MRYLGGPYTAAQTAERIQREIDNDRQFGIQYWQIFAADAFVGVCGLKPYKVESREHELGFHLLPEFQRLGYASEAAGAGIELTFTELGAIALYAGHHPENARSRTLLMRLGFEQIGTHYFAPTRLQHPWYRLGSRVHGAPPRTT